MKLFVGNLSFKATEEDLTDFFKDAGHSPVEVKIITDRDTGRSRGFGFVTLADDADLSRVVGDTNGQQLLGRALTVNEAKPMEPRSSKGRTGGYSRGEPRW